MDDTSLKTAQLLAIQKHIATKCASVNRAWLECKDKHQDPKQCTEVGKQVLQCTNDLYKDISNRAALTLETYSRCLDYNTYKLEMCVKERQDFEKACPPTADMTPAST
eukprot:jgi/Ulvmu1/11908/UM081_0067.1